MVEVLEGIENEQIREGRRYTLSQAALDPSPDGVAAYAKLTDSNIEGELDRFEKQEPALEFEKRFINRKMMRVAGMWDFQDPSIKTALGKSEDIVAKVLEKYQRDKGDIVELDKNTVLCSLADFHQGMKEQDPMRHVFFYSTHDARAAGTLEDATASNVLQLSCYIFYNPKRDQPNRGDHVNRILKLLNQGSRRFAMNARLEIASSEGM